MSGRSFSSQGIEEEFKKCETPVPEMGESLRGVGVSRELRLDELCEKASCEPQELTCRSGAKRWRGHRPALSSQGRGAHPHRHKRAAHRAFEQKSRLEVSTRLVLAPAESYAPRPRENRASARGSRPAIEVLPSQRPQAQLALEETWRHGEPELVLAPAEEGLSSNASFATASSASTASAAPWQRSFRRTQGRAHAVLP